MLHDLGLQLASVAEGRREVMIEGMEGKPETGKGPSAGGVEDGFQDSIKRAMERMRESEQGLHVRSQFCEPVLGPDDRVVGRFDTRRR